jgi:hypothetical protein
MSTLNRQAPGRGDRISATNLWGKRQSPTFKASRVSTFGAWLLVIPWDLDVGIWSLFQKSVLSAKSAVERFDLFPVTLLM